MDQLNATCPTCDAKITLPPGTEVTEIISCNDCQTRLVVEKLDTRQAVLQAAPAVEEDWGE